MVAMNRKHIGQYGIVGLIGRGGMGTVYRLEKKWSSD
jgi:hypothetical protein